MVWAYIWLKHALRRINSSPQFISRTNSCEWGDLKRTVELVQGLELDIVNFTGGGSLPYKTQYIKFINNLCCSVPPPAILLSEN